MKWISHITLSGVVAYAATQDPLPAAAAAVGAVFPDKVEGTPGSVGWKSWRSRHRGWSHWPMLYIALLGIQMRMCTAMVNRLEICILYPPVLCIVIIQWR